MRNSVKSMIPNDDLFGNFEKSKKPLLTLSQLSKLRPLRYPPVKWEGIADCSFSDEENQTNF